MLLLGIILHFIYVPPNPEETAASKKTNFKHNINTSNIK